MKRVGIILLVILFIASCEDNSVDYGYDRYYEEFVTVISKNVFLLDSGKTVYNTTDLSKEFSAGERLILHYTLLDEKTSGYDYTIRINGVRTIAYSQLLKVSEKDIEEFPAEAVRLESLWLGSHYLNMQLYINYKSEAHKVSLMADSTRLNNDTVHVFFKHDSGNDPAGYPVLVYLSFDLEEALGSPMKERVVSVNINTSNYGEKDYELIY